MEGVERALSRCALNEEVRQAENQASSHVFGGEASLLLKRASGSLKAAVGCSHRPTKGGVERIVKGKFLDSTKCQTELFFAYCDGSAVLNETRSRFG